MLVLTLEADRSIIIGEDIRVKVLQIQSHQVKIGIDAPANIPVDRHEVRLSKIETGTYIPTGKEAK